MYDDLIDQLDNADKGDVNGIYRAFVKPRKQRELEAAQVLVMAARRWLDAL